MVELNNISLDLLLRIDFGALVSSAEEDDSDEEELYPDLDELEEEEEREQEEINQEIQGLKEKYQFGRLYQRAFSYVRLSGTGANHAGYLAYCADLAEAEKFECPSLEMAIGLFVNDELKAFLSADTGNCFNVRGHLDALEEIFINDESDIFGENTFFAEVEFHKIRLHYTPHNPVIDVDAVGNEEFLFSKMEFRKELDALIERVATGLQEINAVLKAMKIEGLDPADVDEVFGMR